MRLFECQECGQLLYFENTRCERCGHPLGYIQDRTALSVLASEDTYLWRAAVMPGTQYRLCANRAFDACNWLVPAGDPGDFCRACRHSRTIPNLDIPENLLLWQRLEAAKHRLIYGLLRLELPLTSWQDDRGHGLAFDFLSAEDVAGSDSGVQTGHANGVITIDIAEADHAEREQNRQDMSEAYRTLLGHFRHESGHYYWDRLVRDGVWHDAYREMFGDERRDYGQSLSDHYAAGAPDGWQDIYVSGYAAAHPWEDFAETWAHYLHIVDTLETASAFGLRVRPETGQLSALAMEIDFDPYRQADFDRLIAAWLPLTYAVNSLNQSMGQPDLYPFVLAPPVMGKLRFIHGLIHGPDGFKLIK